MTNFRKDSKNNWAVDSWTRFQANQQPMWPNSQKLKESVDEITNSPPLVFAGEINKLKNRLADAGQGKSFLLQGGDCAETFAGSNAVNTREKFKILLQMTAILSECGSRKVVTVGRIAGQYAKPRTNPLETRNGITLPAYRGDSVNQYDFDKHLRIPNPQRMVEAYHHSASTINLLRAFTMGGYADLTQPHIWNQSLFTNNTDGNFSNRLIKVVASLRDNQNKSNQLSEIYTSHEALLLEYEQALTRQDSLTGNWVNCSAHLLWIGDRTRHRNSAHVELLSGVENPIGIKIGPTTSSDDLLEIIEKLNPLNELGKILLITRMGADKIQEFFPPILTSINRAGLNVIWVCDPMHGNTFRSDTGQKTRSFNTIMNELESFFQIHKEMGTIPGGVHFELTGELVTECLGGAQQITHLDLKQKYESVCDPRLNNEQSLELAFKVADLISK
jgi:3-deoxy-7-phosphoheptulonate synthase